MISSFILCLLFLGITFFNKFEYINASNKCRCPDDLTDGPNLGPLPPRPGEPGSQVPPNWHWEHVLVNDLCSPNPRVRNQAAKTYERNILNSNAFAEENRIRDEYEAKEQEHIRNKQLQYNENMKKEWQQDRMKTVPPECVLLRR